MVSHLIDSIIMGVGFGIGATLFAVVTNFFKGKK